MATIVEQITAIDANSALTDDEKRNQKYTLKCTSLADAVKPWLTKTLAYQGINYIIYRAEAKIEKGQTVLAVNVSAKRQTTGEVLLNPTDEYVFVNPPVLTSDKRESLVETAQQMIARLIPNG